MLTIRTATQGPVTVRTGSLISAGRSLPAAGTGATTRQAIAEFTHLSLISAAFNLDRALG